MIVLTYYIFSFSFVITRKYVPTITRTTGTFFSTIKHSLNAQYLQTDVNTQYIKFSNH